MYDFRLGTVDTPNVRVPIPNRNSEIVNPELSDSIRVFTESELRQYDGRNGRPVYIAYDGIVYDVSDAPLWRTGMHKDLHYSGLDLTRSIRKAPHTSSVFERPYIRKVGVLTNEHP